MPRTSKGTSYMAKDKKKKPAKPIPAGKYSRGY